jgi:uncharacterized membrane protein YagU involved in acid resistance
MTSPEGRAFTAFSNDRRRAKAIGYALHFLAGLVFALMYWVAFRVLDESSWWLGALFGLVHVAFAGSALVNVLLPVVHPRLGTQATSARRHSWRSSTKSPTG